MILGGQFLLRENFFCHYMPASCGEITDLYSRYVLFFDFFSLSIRPRDTDTQVTILWALLLFMVWFCVPVNQPTSPPTLPSPLPLYITLLAKG